MTEDDEKNFRSAKLCYLCEKEDKKLGPLVRDHNHSTGEYLGAAHDICNKLRKKNLKMPIYCHNWNGYDSHFVIKVLNSTKMTPQILPKNTERIISLNLNMYQFRDSMSFLNSSLSNLVDILVKDGHNFPYLKLKNFTEEQNKMATRKGIFPYDFVTSIEQLEKTKKLPPQSKFYSLLNGESVSNNDYKFAKKVWKAFDIKNMKEYTALYCEIDVILLAEAFLNFRKVCLREFKLDPTHFISLPAYSYNAMLLLTKVEIQMPPSINIFNFIQKAVRGGHAFINQRLCHALRPKSAAAEKLKNKILNFQNLEKKING